MGIFKRKKEPIRINKTLVIVIEFFVAIFIFLIAIGLKWLMANGYNPRIVKLQNQEVNGITFSDFVVDYSDGNGNLSVNAINYSNEEVKIEKLTLILYAKDNTVISRIELPEEIVIKPKENYLINNEIATETRVGKVEYKVE